MFVLEGENSPGNVSSLREMERASSNPQVRFLVVSGADHFSILAPTTQFIARKLVSDDGPATHLAIAAEELNKLFAR